ncbi:MAG TPA: SurA N-terminal domain-containing protein [Thermoanaerobaculia bacterium]
MLKVFRDNLKNLAWILWVIIILFILALAADFGASVRGGGNAAMAAKVGGEQVSIAEFQSEYQRLQNLYRQVYGDQLTPEMEKQMGLAMQALNSAVDRKILTAEARRLGLAVSDAELQDHILKMPDFQDEQGHFIGDERYTQLLQRARINPASFESEIRQGLLLKKLTDALSAGLYIGDDEVQRAYRDQVERAKIRYLQLPRARFAAEAEAQVQPAAVATYFAAHQQDFRLPEQREAAYLLVDGSRLADQVQISDADLQSWYDAHKAELTREEQVQARHILVMTSDKRTDEQARQRSEEAKRRLAGGADFAAVAREISEDPASKDKGGDLGWFGRSGYAPELVNAAFSAQPGQLIGPLKTGVGYELLEVTGKRPGGTPPFAQMKEQIRIRLSYEKARKLAETRAKDLADRLAKDKPRSAEALRALAQPPGVTFAESGRFGPQDPVAGLGPSPLFTTAAFALKKGDVSQAVQVAQGWAILYLKEIYPPRVPTLAEVEPRVRAAMTSQKLQQIAMSKLEEARRQMAQGKTLDQVAAELGAAVKETEEFGAQGQIPGLGNNPELAKAALALQTGQVGGPIADAQGALLFQVTDHKGWDPKQFASNREQTRAGLVQQRVSRLEDALIEKRKRELKVEYDRKLLEQFDIAPEQQG